VSLVVACYTCVHPRNSRQVVQWRQNCADCAQLCVDKHLAEFPDHRVELTGFVSETPFGAATEIRRLFGVRDLYPKETA
jgi:hypothetical protein